jgi:hypothetical protein
VYAFVFVVAGAAAPRFVAAGVHTTSKKRQREEERHILLTASKGDDTTRDTHYVKWVSVWVKELVSNIDTFLFFFSGMHNGLLCKLWFALLRRS